MKQNYTHITVILDKSGSMAPTAKDSIGGFNQFIEDQKILGGEATLTFCTFNGTHSIVHDFVKLDQVPNLDSKTYSPSGNTALLDAMGATINSVGTKLGSLPENERPSKVLFLIITDGEENYSKEFTKEKIQEMVAHQQSKYNWRFSFIGAENIDAIAGGASVGIVANNTLSYQPTSAGTQKLYRSLSDSTTKYRTSSTDSDFEIK